MPHNRNLLDLHFLATAHSADSGHSLAHHAQLGHDQQQSRTQDQGSEIRFHTRNDTPNPYPSGKQGLRAPLGLALSYGLAAKGAGIYACYMDKVRPCNVPEGSLLAGFGAPSDYRDCFYRVVPETVELSQLIGRFYASAAFWPERFVLGLIGKRSSASALQALVQGESDRFAVWQVVERQEFQILLESRGTGTASWLAVEVLDGGRTKLMFGSWVGGVEQSGWRFMLRPHRLYSRLLLGGV